MLYETMIVDIDSEKSVLSIVRDLTAAWFSVDDLYIEIKASGKTESSGFWNITSTLLDTIANYLHMMPDNFREQWNRQCSVNALKIMGYHCTRHRNQDVFLRRGILPLSDEIISAFFSEIAALLPSSSLNTTALVELTKNVSKDNMWKYRSGKEAGPYFFISYKEAKNQDNDFHKSGPEIWWLCTDNLLGYCHENNIDIACSDRFALRDIISGELLPFIIHCEIPYSMIPFKDDCAFYMLRAFFTSSIPKMIFTNFALENQLI
jgi:hypothetical protein